MSQAHRSRITVFDEEIREGMRGFWIGWKSPPYTTAFTDTVAAIKSLPLLFRKYDPDDKLWWVAAEAIATLARELTDLETYASQWRRVGAGRRATPPPPPSLLPPKVEAAFRCLHLMPDAPPELVKAARRVYAQMHHPDLGGSDTTMKVINDAADIAQKWADRCSAAAAA